MKKVITILAVTVILLALSCAQRMTEPILPDQLTLNVQAVFNGNRAPEEVFFSTHIIGGKTPYVFFWTFGDGSNGDSEQPVHSYTHAGTYTAIVNVTSEDGQKAGDTLTVTVLSQNSLIANATAAPPRARLPFTATLLGEATGGLSPYTYQWIIGEETVFSHMQNTEFTPTNPGTTRIILEVRSADGQIAIDTVTVTASTTPIPNEPPVVKMKVAPSNGLVDSTIINCSAEGSYDPEGKRIEILWDFGDGESSIGVNVEHVYHAIGLFRIECDVKDDSGAVSKDNRYVQIDSILIPHNQPPVALINCNPTTGIKDSTVFSLSSERSHDADGRIVSSVWDFGDGTSLEGANVTHVYHQKGLYRITLKVTDNSGVTDFADVFVQVNDGTTRHNQPPVAILTVSPSRGIADSTLFVCTSTSYDPDGRIIKTSWDFGDGITAQGTPTHHTYTEVGIYRVMLTVTDDSNAVGTAYTFVQVDSLIVPGNQPPVASATVTPTTGIVNMTNFAFDASGSTDDHGITSYNWTFGDGTSGAGAKVQHVYADVGLFRATVTVADAAGLTSSADEYVQVDTVTIHHNVSPIIVMDVEPTSGVRSVTQFLFSADGTHDVDGTITKYQWTFDDGATAEGVHVSHTYADTGLFKITLAVTDDSGAVSQDVRYVWVWPTAPPVQQDTCWEFTITTDMLARIGNPRVETEIQNPAGEWWIEVTLEYTRYCPDLLSAIEFFRGERRIPFVIADPFPGFIGRQIVKVRLPQPVVLEADESLALTLQALYGNQSNTVRLVKIMGCTNMFTSGH